MEYSAAGYQALRSYHAVEAGAMTPFVVSLKADVPPPELRPDVINSRLRPGYTMFHEYIVDASTSEPIAGVKVRVLNARVEAETDSRGYFWLYVPEPVPDRPVTDTVVYEKHGYKTLVLRTFMFSGEEMGGSAVEIEKGSGVREVDTHHLDKKDNEAVASTPSTFDSGNAKLRAKFYDWITEPGVPFRVGSATIQSKADVQAYAAAIPVPQRIKVGHNCMATACATWEEMPLEDYVQRGLPAEWFNYWHTDALKAGAVAYRSYGAWFVANPISPNYDICDNTYCQVYNPAAKPSNAKSRAAVSATAGLC